MKILLMTAAFICSGRVVSTAWAGNVVNNDTKVYKIDITCDGATTHASLGPHTVQEDIVVKACVIKIKGGTSHVMKADRDVTIKNGKLTEV